MLRRFSQVPHAPCLSAGEVIGADRRQSAAATSTERLVAQQVPGAAVLPRIRSSRRLIQFAALPTVISRTKLPCCPSIGKWLLSR
jgi:hypothetical protein